MFTVNPFAELATSIPSIAIQLFTLSMVLLVVIGTLMDILHKKNVKYFFQNAKKAKKQAKRVLESGERASIVFKTIRSDILTTAELGAGKRRVAHLLGMYGTIIFWASSAILVFSSIFKYYWLGYFIFNFVRFIKYSFIWRSILVKICSYVL